jgi:hypothetical protein
LRPDAALAFDKRPEFDRIAAAAKRLIITAAETALSIVT